MKELEANGQPVPGNLRSDVMGDDRPANAWNGIVASHAGYGIKGVLWYQGEGNAPRGHQYRELFPLLIESWRKEWGQGDFSFYWVQLADYKAEVEKPGDSDVIGKLVKDLADAGKPTDEHTIRKQSERLMAEAKAQMMKEAK